MKEIFMKKALLEAFKALKNDEVPIGCVIVKDGAVIARAHNLRETKKKATAHAEILAIEKACKKLGDWRLDGCELYVTLEPCIMCAGAILNARIKKVYFGAREPKGGAVESRFQLLDKGALNWTTDFEGGVLDEDCALLITEFFRKKRQEGHTS